MDIPQEKASLSPGPKVQANRYGLSPDVSKVAIAVVMAYYFMSVVYSIYTQRYYFADGAHIFISLLQNGFFHLQTFDNRLYAHYLTEFLPVGAIKILGLRDFTVLSYLFGINLYLPEMSCLLICYSIIPMDRKYLMIFPLISLFGISMNSAFVMVSEAHVISSIFWPILFYVTLKDRYSFRDVFILLGLSIIFVRSYESAVFLGPILGFVSVLKVFNVKGKQRIMWFVLIALFFTSTAIAGYEALYPRDPSNRAHFVNSIYELHAHLPVLMSICALFLIGVNISLPGLSKKYFGTMVAFLSCVVLFISFGPLLGPYYIRPNLQYNARVLMAFLIPLLSILCLLVVWKWIKIDDTIWRQVWITVVILIFGQVSWHFLATSQWAGFRKVFKQELSTHQGFVAFERTMLANAFVGNQLLKPMTWGWTTPTLSILWSEKGEVLTLIANYGFNQGGWQPFDPAQKEGLPKIESFGFSFKKYVDRKTTDLLAGDKTYQFGTPLTFYAQGNAFRYMGDGWSDPETSHIWTIGNKASLSLKTASPPDDLIMDMEIIPFVVPGKLLQQRLILMVNGEEVGKATLHSYASIQFKIPKETWARKDEALIQFLLPDAASPRSIGYNEDNRVIALGFRRLTIRCPNQNPPSI